MSTMRERYEFRLRQSVERYFRGFFTEHRLILASFKFQPVFGGREVDAAAGPQAFLMGNDSGGIGVENIVTSLVWHYPAHGLGEHLCTSERKKVCDLLDLVQSDEFLSASKKTPVPFSQNITCDGPVI